MKWFKVKLDIGIAGDVQADHYVVSDGLLRFYSSAATTALDQPLAVYALASVSSVEECRDGTHPRTAPWPSEPGKSPFGSVKSGLGKN